MSGFQIQYGKRYGNADFFIGLLFLVKHILKINIASLERNIS